MISTEDNISNHNILPPIYNIINIKRIINIYRRKKEREK